MLTPNIRPLNLELQKVANDELNEVDNRIAADINDLRAWIEMQPHLNARTDDQFLVSFLRGCKYSLEKVKSKLDYYYTIRTMMPELFANRVMNEKFKKLCKSGFYVCLPKPLGEGGPRIHLSCYSKFDVKIVNFVDIFRFQFMLMDWQIYNDDNCLISGCIEILDFSNMSLSIIKHFDAMLFKKLSVYTEKGAPIRIKGFHLVNCPKEAQALLSLTRSFLSEKIKQRFFIHKSLDDLYKSIPREYLPIEYGGTNGTIDNIVATTEQHLIDFESEFAKDEQYGVNEILRAGKKVNADTLFGIEGSFRKLDID